MKRNSFFARLGLVSLVLFGANVAGPAPREASAASLGPSMRGLVVAVDPASLAASVRPESAALPVPAAPPAPPQAPVDAFPGRTYGRFDGATCLRMLDERGITYERFGRARGVETPVRLSGPLHGVEFRSDTGEPVPSARREVFDCRLALALDDLAGALSLQGITEVLHYGIYRDDVPLPAKGRPLHHAAAMAIDVSGFVKSDGTRLEVKRDWRGRVGARTCSDSAPSTSPGASTTAATAAATRELRGILCGVARSKTFHQILTPNHDRSHRDHFHLEVMRNTSWTILE